MCIRDRESSFKYQGARLGRQLNPWHLVDQCIKEIEKKIPGNINWIIQIEGHTDSRPIQTSQYASNWELSSARATSVLKLLVSAGITPKHLAATGYADSHPISLGEVEDSFIKY